MKNVNQTLLRSERKPDCTVIEENQLGDLVALSKRPPVRVRESSMEPLPVVEYLVGVHKPLFPWITAVTNVVRPSSPADQSDSSVEYKDREGVFRSTERNSHQPDICVRLLTFAFEALVQLGERTPRQEDQTVLEVNPLDVF